MNMLDEAKNNCKNCNKCELAKTRTNTVFSDGVENSIIMLIGEAPGYWEDQKGRPFVGRAGALLDQILAAGGFYRDKNIYICNTVKCRPPENRVPTQEEKAACRPFLDAQIEFIKPKIILLCGAVAMESMLGMKSGITKVRGQWFDAPNGAKMMPIFHPSYLLRNPSKEKGSPKWLMWQDIKKIRAYYEELLS